MSKVTSERYRSLSPSFEWSASGPFRSDFMARTVVPSDDNTPSSPTILPKTRYHPYKEASSHHPHAITTHARPTRHDNLDPQILHTKVTDNFVSTSRRPRNLPHPLNLAVYDSYTAHAYTKKVALSLDLEIARAELRSMRAGEAMIQANIQFHVRFRSEDPITLRREAEAFAAGALEKERRIKEILERM